MFITAKTSKIKENIASNYRSITCLPICKTLTEKSFTFVEDIFKRCIV